VQGATGGDTLRFDASAGQQRGRGRKELRAGNTKLFSLPSTIPKSLQEATMTDTTTLALLRRCSRELNRRLPNIAANRALAAKVDGYLRALIEPPAAPNMAEVIARLQTADLEHLTVDRGEQAIRLHPDGVQVRAWWLVPRDALLALEDLDPEIVAAAAALAPEARDVLRLSRIEGMNGETIAAVLGIPRERVRGHFRQIIGWLGRRRKC
jgi:DNA-directed RNA polymerase specialized sigma24 family protein